MDYFARFTEGAKNALACAAEYAKSMGHNYVGTEHLLVGMLQEKGAMASSWKRRTFTRRMSTA